MSKLRALLFDLDGLIFDSEKVYYRYWKQAGEECGCVIPEETLLSLRSCDSRVARLRLESSVGGGGMYDRIRARRRELMRPYLTEQEPEVKPGVESFLQAAAQIEGLKKAVVTQSRRKEKENLLRRAGLLPYFDEVVAEEDVVWGKPFPDMYVCACRRLSLDPGECIAYEDSPNGIMSASSAGIHVIMIPDMSQPDKALSERCFGVFSNIADSLPLVRGLMETGSSLS